MTRLPNLIFILADDLGYADLGCNGARAQVSPNLDRMALEGMRFLNGYSNSPVCSPTRFALATGRYQYRLPAGAEEPLTARAKGSETIGLPPGHPTLASMLCDAGYATALFGKWHLGWPPHFGPLKSGYQRFFGSIDGAVDYFSYKNRNGERDLWDDEEAANAEGYFTDLISQHAVEYIKNHADVKPFFMSVHYTAPHWPWESRDDRKESQRIGSAIEHIDGGSIDTYRRMIHHMDEGIGEILAAVEARGWTENTLIVFTSDNGGERFSDNWPFVGQKMDLLEGGIRVPLIARWPACIAPGSITETAVITMDWTATFLAAAGVEPHPDCPLDGLSLTPLFAEPQWKPDRELCWRMLHRNQRALLSDNWKYLSMDGHDYLFDLSSDPRERANLARRYPDLLDDLRDRWRKWAETMPAIPEEARISLVFDESTIPRASH